MKHMGAESGHSLDSSLSYKSDVNSNEQSKVNMLCAAHSGAEPVGEVSKLLLKIALQRFNKRNCLQLRQRVKLFWS